MDMFAAYTFRSVRKRQNKYSLFKRLNWSIKGMQLYAAVYLLCTMPHAKNAAFPYIHDNTS